MNTASPETHDKAGEEYWSRIWATGESPRPVDLQEGGFRNHLRLSLHRKYSEVFAALPTHSMRLLEIGCGNSIWLPYFARQFGFGVTGVDYSEEGCRTSRALLAAAGVQGTVRCVDVFARPEDMRRQYDVVVSFGVVEHFQDPSICLSAFRHYLKPNGLVLTLVPNFSGIVGDLTRIINPYLYSIHIPFNRRALADVHEKAGLTVESCEYLFGFNLAVINLTGAPKDRLDLIRRCTLNLFRGVTAAIWAAERLIRPLPATRYFSPYIFCVARG